MSAKQIPDNVVRADIQAQYDKTSDARYADLLAEHDRLVGRMGSIAHEIVSHVMAKVFAELPPDVVPIVREAMARAAGWPPATDEHPFDINEMVDQLAHPN